MGPKSGSGTVRYDEESQPHQQSPWDRQTRPQRLHIDTGAGFKSQSRASEAWHRRQIFIVAAFIGGFLVGLLIVIVALRTHGKRQGKLYML
jgi:hypothetical protein